MLSPGDKVARYTVIGLLGRGGMGEVYEAEDTVLRRRVALKIVLSRHDHESIQRMLREARAAAAFDHPNAVTMFDAGVMNEGGAEEQAYLAMELVRGKTLRDHLVDATVPVPKKLRWMVDVARALAAAHRAGLVHRDVKPDNVMVREDGRIKVLDFGIAKWAAAVVDPSAPTQAPTKSDVETQKGSFVGTPLYAAPEQLRGETVDGRTDQYAWAVTTYELLSGVTPFQEHSGVALVSHILTSPVPSLGGRVKGIPDEVEAAITKALSKEASDRFSSLDEAADRLESHAAGSVVTGKADATAAPRKRSAAVRVARGVGRGVLWLATGIGGLVLLAIVGGAIAGKLKVDWGRNSEASVSSSAAAPAALIAPAGFACRDAVVTGTGATPELAHTLGVAACARLGIDTGSKWSHDAAKAPGSETFVPVEVSVTLGSPVVTTITAMGATASAEGTSPMDSMKKAVTALSPRFTPPPMSDAERGSWGARDDASARRIERAWRRLVIGDSIDAERDIRVLIEQDGDSAWPHAMMCLVAPRGSASMVTACKATLERIGTVTPSRAKALEAVAVLIGDNERVEHAVRLFRQAYQDAPEDPDVAGLYGAVVLDIAPDEGFSVIDRVAEQFPSYAIVPLTNAVSAPSVRDAARNARYIEKLTAIVPEEACHDRALNELVASMRLDEARARVDLCTALFGKGDTDFFTSLHMAEIELAALQPERVRPIVSKLLSDPRQQVRQEAARQVIAAYVIAGQLNEAFAALDAEMNRQRDQQSPRYAMQRAITMIRLKVMLGMPVDDKLATFAREALAQDTAAASSFKLRLEALLANVKSGGKAADQELAKQISESKVSSDPILCLRFLRKALGDEKARELLASKHGVATRALVVGSFEHALLLAKVKAPDAEIEAALALAMLPDASDVTGLDKVAARLMLAKLYEKQGKKADAAKLLAEVDRAWAKADPGVRAKIESLIP